MRLGRRGRETRLRRARKPECTRCPLHESTTHRCIMGHGNTMGKIMLIGEAPGAAESTTGKPFQGPAGMLLRAMLRDFGVIDQAFITNAAKCRPPGNRDPKPGELTRCAPFLLEELRTVDPRVIVALGRIACKAIRIDHRDRGRVQHSPISWVNAPVIATYHPAYILRVGINSDVGLDFGKHLLRARQVGLQLGKVQQL